MASIGDDEDSHLSGLKEELEVLESIYLDELVIDKQDTSSDFPETVSLDVHPATADNTEQQYVRATLLIKLTSQYPDTVPEIIIQNPRGLACEELDRITSSLRDLAKQLRGGPMLYELIEQLKEHLTEGNVPHGSCVICLECFHDGERYTKTTCYHHFHQSCLSRYVKHCVKEYREMVEGTSAHLRHPGQDAKIGCPVCREPLQNTESFLAENTMAAEDDISYKIDPQIRQWQQDVAAIYRKQKEQGGIIDVEEERNKFLITPGMTIGLPQSMSSNLPVDNEAQRSSKNKEVSFAEEHSVHKSSRQSYQRRKWGDRKHSNMSRNKNFDHAGDNWRRPTSGRLRDRNQVHCSRSPGNSNRVVGCENMSGVDTKQCSTAISDTTSHNTVVGPGSVDISVSHESQSGSHHQQHVRRPRSSKPAKDIYNSEKITGPSNRPVAKHKSHYHNSPRSKSNTKTTGHRDKEDQQIGCARTDISCAKENEKRTVSDSTSQRVTLDKEVKEGASNTVIVKHRSQEYEASRGGKSRPYSGRGRAKRAPHHGTSNRMAAKAESMRPSANVSSLTASVQSTSLD